MDLLVQYSFNKTQQQPFRMSPQVITALEPDPAQISWVQKVAGGACLGAFVATWLASLASPAILVYAVWKEYYVVTLLIVGTTVVSYWPWKPGFLAESVRHVVKTYTPCYFKSIVIAFQGDNNKEAKLPTPDDPPTFYAVHPHGAFCIGTYMIFEKNFPLETQAFITH